MMPAFAVLVLSRLYHSSDSFLSKFMTLVRIGVVALLTFLVVHYQLIMSGTFFHMYEELFPFHYRQAVEQALPTFWRFVDLFYNLKVIKPLTS